MSAICGVVGLDGRPWTVDDLGGVRRALAPLGPDGGGAWAGTAGRCGVAVAAALRHATPEDRADRQPATSEDGSLVLVADLRLDNRDELAALLGVRDDRSTPDSAFVLAAYGRWGESFLGRILGEFALALVDRRRGGVLLARDHVGARPLVFHQRPRVVAFASNALALTAFEGVGHRLDVRRAAEVLALAYLSERTFVEGVRALPPGEARWVGDSGMKHSTWWRPDPHEIVDAPPAVHEHELREALDHAVAARLRSAGPVGAMVSGGLDSTSAAATAARLLAPEPLRTYTSAPPPGWSGGARPRWDADDSPFVRKLAELYRNVTPSFVQVTRGTSVFDLHEPLWELGAAPGWNPCNWLWFHAISLRAQEDGVTTLVSGGSGNCAFSADAPEWLVSLLRARRIGTAVREALAWSRLSGEGLYRTLRSHVVSPLVPPRARRALRAARGKPDAVGEWLTRTPLRPELAAELELPKLRPMLDDRRRPDGRRFLLWFAVSAAGFAEAKAALTGLTRVEERDPTVDRRVLEVAIRQPDWVRRRDGVRRAAVRGAMADRLPAEIVHRTRYGEQLPDWLDVMTAARRELASELDQLAEHPTSRQLIDVDRLRGLMERWPARTARADPAVERDYRRVLFRALLLSRYLRWFELRDAVATGAREDRAARANA